MTAHHDECMCPYCEQLRHELPRAVEADEKAIAAIKPLCEAAYRAGWNSALEVAIGRLESWKKESRRGG